MQVPWANYGINNRRRDMNSVAKAAPSQVTNIFNAAQRLTLTERLVLAKLLLESVLGVEDATTYLQNLQQGQENATASTTDSGWPQGFFESTAGAWAGEPLVREPQGDYEIRDELQ
jgi:hypothetical protein